jgi:transketolase
VPPPDSAAGSDRLALGKAQRMRDGSDATVIACGLMVALALEAAHALEADGLSCRVLDMHTVKPVDVEAVAAAARETGHIVTAEEHLLDGGLGSAVARVVAAEAPCRMGFVGIDDTYATSGKPEELLAAYGLTAAAIAEQVRRLLGRR